MTNPENGITSHYYNADAKSPKLEYIYDSRQRATMVVQRYPNGTIEDAAQRTEFQYEDWRGFSQFNVGIRTAIASGPQPVILRIGEANSQTGVFVSVS